MNLKGAVLGMGVFCNRSVVSQFVMMITKLHNHEDIMLIAF